LAAEPVAAPEAEPAAAPEEEPVVVPLPAALIQLRNRHKTLSLHQEAFHNVYKISP